ncbi:MAG: hypothetical protein WA921_14775 [Ahrensia sp.]
MDYEKGVRAELISILEIFFDCFEEVPVLANDCSKRRIDVLAVTQRELLTPACIAFEVKSKVLTNPGNLKDAMWQASRYVGGTFDEVFNRAGEPRVDYAVVFPSTRYAWSHAPGMTTGEEQLLTGIQFMAERLRVGYMYPDNTGHQICFGPAEFWHQSKGWQYDAKHRLRTHHIGCDPFAECTE